MHSGRKIATRPGPTRPERPGFWPDPRFWLWNFNLWVKTVLSWIKVPWQAFTNAFMARYQDADFEIPANNDGPEEEPFEVDFTRYLHHKKCPSEIVQGKTLYSKVCINPLVFWNSKLAKEKIPRVREVAVRVLSIHGASVTPNVFFPTSSSWSRLAKLEWDQHESMRGPVWNVGCSLSCFQGACSDQNKSRRWSTGRWSQLRRNVRIARKSELEFWNL